MRRGGYLKRVQVFPPFSRLLPYHRKAVWFFRWGAFAELSGKQINDHFLIFRQFINKAWWHKMTDLMDLQSDVVWLLLCFQLISVLPVGTDPLSLNCLLINHMCFWEPPPQQGLSAWSSGPAYPLGWPLASGGRSAECSPSLLLPFSPTS